MKNSSEEFIEQLRVIIDNWKVITERHGDYIPSQDIMRLLTQAKAAIERTSPKGSAYQRTAEMIMSEPDYEGSKVPKLIGVLESIRSDIQSGYINTIEELIHGDVFSDFLEMATYLLESGYKDAAAVIAGSTLEAHLRKMCVKAQIEIKNKADRINADLASESVYGKLDQKNVTAWLDLRNKAAHGEYNQYTKEQVAILIDGIRHFITRYPA
jgi:hypothetical protein